MPVGDQFSKLFRVPPLGGWTSAFSENFSVGLVVSLEFELVFRTA
jgi:hypothetical protein